MKKLIKKVLVGVFAVSHMTAVVAATINPHLAKQDVCDRYELLHINGINTDIDGARANLLELSNRFGNSHNQHLLRFGLAYNTTDGATSDLVQSVNQLMSMYPGSTFREWMVYIMQGLWPNSVVATAAGEVYGTIATLVSNIRRPVLYWTTDPDMPRMMSEIAQFHRSGRIVFVGHSQGTIYANIIYNILTSTAGYKWPNYTGPAFKIPATRLGLVAVAAAVTSVPGGTHITSSNDAVIDAIRKIVPATRPPTHTLTYYPTIDALGHNFRDTYLAQVSGAIVSAVGSKFDTLKPQYNDLTNYSVGPWAIQGWAAWHKCQPWAPCALGQTTGEQITYAKSPTTIYPSTQIVPNLPISREGSYGEMLPLANSFAATCVNTLVGNRIKRVTAGGIPWDDPNIPGCSNPRSGGRESYAWMLWSTDGMIIKPIPNSIAPESAGTAEARVFAYPFCKKPV